MLGFFLPHFDIYCQLHTLLKINFKIYEIIIEIELVSDFLSKRIHKAITKRMNGARLTLNAAGCAVHTHTNINSETGAPNIMTVTAFVTPINNILHVFGPTRNNYQRILVSCLFIMLSLSMQ